MSKISVMLVILTLTASLSPVFAQSGSLASDTAWAWPPEWVNNGGLWDGVPDATWGGTLTWDITTVTKRTDLPDWGDWGDPTLTGATYLYDYKLLTYRKDGTRGGGISNVITEVTKLPPDAADANDFYYRVRSWNCPTAPSGYTYDKTTTGDPTKWQAAGGWSGWNAVAADDVQDWTKDGNQTIPATFYGIKIDNLDYCGVDKGLEWQLLTWHAPVRGNFFAKDGNCPPAKYLYNSGLSTGSDYIMRPDGGSHEQITPELSSWALLMVGAMAVIGLKRRRKT